MGYADISRGRFFRGPSPRVRPGRDGRLWVLALRKGRIVHGASLAWFPIFCSQIVVRAVSFPRPQKQLALRSKSNRLYGSDRFGRILRLQQSPQEGPESKRTPLFNGERPFRMSVGSATGRAQTPSGRNPRNTWRCRLSPNRNVAEDPPRRTRTASFQMPCGSARTTAPFPTHRCRGTVPPLDNGMEIRHSKSGAHGSRALPRSLGVQTVV